MITFVDLHRSLHAHACHHDHRHQCSGWGSSVRRNSLPRRVLPDAGMVLLWRWWLWWSMMVEKMIVMIIIIIVTMIIMVFKIIMVILKMMIIQARDGFSHYLDHLFWTVCRQHELRGNCWGMSFTIICKIPDPECQGCLVRRWNVDIVVIISRIIACFPLVLTLTFE